MCIRDRLQAVHLPDLSGFSHLLMQLETPLPTVTAYARAARAAGVKVCLLYTSDAADERSSVDLGGRRIIKKKKMIKELTR